MNVYYNVCCLLFPDKRKNHLESGSVALNTLHCALTGSDQEQSFNFYRPIPAGGVNIGEPIVHRTSPIVVPLVPVPLTTIGTALSSSFIHCLWVPLTHKVLRNTLQDPQFTQCVFHTDARTTKKPGCEQSKVCQDCRRGMAEGGWKGSAV